jgi:hypothetical protein
MGNYITINDIDNWPAGLDDTQKEEIITRCEKLVEQVTRSFFYSKNFDIRLSGNNTQRLFFPYVQPIITVTAVYIEDEELPSDNWDYDSFSVFRIDEEKFEDGINNIRIVGTYGYASTPEPIKQAVKILVRAENDPTLYTRVFEGTERLGDYSYSVERILTGIVEADRLLRPYVRRHGALL